MSHTGKLYTGWGLFKNPSACSAGHRAHPAFRIRRPALRSCPDDGSPVYCKAIALIYMRIPGLGLCFGPRRHGATPAAHHIATRLHAYRATHLGLHAAARPVGGRAARGRPRAMLPFLRGVPSGPPESRLHLQAFFRNRAARPKIPGLRRGTPSAFPRTHCAIINRRARAPAFVETRAAFAPPR